MTMFLHNTLSSPEDPVVLSTTFSHTLVIVRYIITISAMEHSDRTTETDKLGLKLATIHSQDKLIYTVNNNNNYVSLLNLFCRNKPD